MHTALVTGATRGIGYAVARALLASGARVAITGRTRKSVDAALASLAKSAGDSSRVAGFAVDVRDAKAVSALVNDIVSRFGSLNVLVNNAGVGVFAPVDQTSDEQWASVIDTNLTGVFFCSRAAIPVMRKAGGGFIINIASLAGRNYFANGAAYCASKAGLVAFSESMMLDVRNDNIRVTVVMPGSVDTDFTGPSGRHEDSSWKLRPDDVSQVVVDLLNHPARSLPSKVEMRPAKTK